MITLRDLSRELHVPMPAEVKCLAGFGRIKTATQEIRADEIALIRDRLIDDYAARTDTAAEVRQVQE
ncbi:MAG TPA: hypothetical protein VG265_09470 [Gaiellaceae bacterium]|nr:hypothetical protein [Gaiellaceae bacterium]